MLKVQNAGCHVHSGKITFLSACICFSDVSMILCFPIISAKMVSKADQVTDPFSFNLSRSAGL
ncbi:MAG: hypothetical protein D3909_00525 [Candidatus Electrothrix sp. ATG1]|nr:hypothetical protein [Candidatus Electrothrix sp. ATG1]